ALGNDVSSVEESFSDGLLEYPHFTKPAVVRAYEVPEILRSGDHARIARWRHAFALLRTIERRPDLIERRGGLSEQDREILGEFNLLEEPRQNG
ncbi:MAG: tRNA (guanosine(37)-N1)-methyltransferase TrmD, partial [Acidobacteria bacterium]|nr:tRNA (guanosine(37)-N1)-methyltransferase TrmD [Acidobacteriota bacterium]